MRYSEILTEGKVYQLDWGYPTPVAVFTNPSPPQARTLVETIRKRYSYTYIRGLMFERKVYVWDGMLITHDDVRGELLSDVYAHSSDLTLFEIQDYTITGLMTQESHDAKLRIAKAGDYNPEQSPFVRNVMTAINTYAPRKEKGA